MSYLLTPEHAEHARCEKDAYMTLEADRQCAYLANIYNRKYEYDVNIVFNAVKEKPGVYEAIIWGGMDKQMSTWRDSLKALVISKEIYVATLVAKNSMDEKEFILSTSFRNGRNDAKEPSTAAVVTIPIQVGGIPLVALQYTTLVLRIECPICPLDAVVTFAILPIDIRRRAAMVSHVIKTFHQIEDNEGRKMYGKRNMYICSGMIGDVPPPGCVVM